MNSQSIPSSKSGMMRSITKHQGDIAVLKEREEYLLSMIRMLEAIIPFALVWYMWKLAVASTADPSSRLRKEQEAKQQLSRLLAALEDLRKEAAEVKSAQAISPEVRGVPIGHQGLQKESSSHGQIGQSTHQQIDPTLKPGSHQLLGGPPPAAQVDKPPGPPAGRVPLKRGYRKIYPMSRSGSSLGEDGSEHSQQSVPKSPDTEAPVTTDLTNVRGVEDAKTLQDTKPDMTEGSRNRARVVREVIEIQRAGQPPEKIEVQPGMEPPNVQAVEELIRQLDNEKNNLQDEMDRIFGPLPEAVARSGGLGGGRERSPGSRGKSREPDEGTPAIESGEPQKGRGPGSPRGRPVVGPPGSTPGAQERERRPKDPSAARHARGPSPGSPYNQGGKGQMPPYDQGAPGQMPPYGQGAPGQMPPYDQGAPGQMPPYGQGAPGQMPPYGQGGPGQMPPYGQGAPGQMPPYGQGGPGQMPPYGQGGPGQMSPYGQGTPGQMPPYGQGAPGQMPPYGQGAPGQMPPYGQGGPGQMSPYNQGAPGQMPPGSQGVPGQIPPYGQGAPHSPESPQHSPTSGTSPEEVKQKLNNIEERLNTIAKRVEDVLGGSNDKRDSIESGDSGFSEEFVERLNELQDKVTKGIQKVEDAIDQEMRRRSRM